MSRIRTLREAHHLTQEELAHAAKTTLAYVGYIERTGYRPGANLRARIAAALEVSEAEVWPEEAKQ